MINRRRQGHTASPEVHSFARLFTCAAVVIALIDGRIAQAQPNPPRAQVVEDLRLDAEKEDFPRIGRIHVGPRGIIAVPVYPDVVIKTFDAFGKLVATVGRKGKGPGEFESISVIGWLGDTMWVSDSRQRRFSYFGADGKLIRTVAAPLVASKSVTGLPGKKVAFMMASHVLRDGSIAGEAFLIGSNEVSLGRSNDRALIAVRRAGTVQFLMKSPELGDSDPRYSIITGGLSNPIPFVEPPQSALSSALDYVAHLRPLQTSPTGGTVSLTLMTTTADTLFSKTFPYRGEPIPKAARDSAIAAELNAGGPNSDAPSGQGRRRNAIAKEKTPYIYAGASSVLVGLDNTVWVGLHPTADGPKFLVFNPKGDAVATVVLPKNTQLRQAHARTMWTIETDDVGLTSVVRYRVTGIPCESPVCR